MERAALLGPHRGWLCLGERSPRRQGGRRDPPDDTAGAGRFRPTSRSGPSLHRDTGRGDRGQERRGLARRESSGAARGHRLSADRRAAASSSRRATRPRMRRSGASPSRRNRRAGSSSAPMAAVGTARRRRADDAVPRLIAALDKIRRAESPVRVLAEVEKMFNALAPLAPEWDRAAYQNLAGALERDEGFRSRFLDNPGQNALVRNTISITLLEGGPATNVAPSVARAQLDARLLPGPDLRRLHRRDRGADRRQHDRDRGGAELPVTRLVRRHAALPRDRSAWQDARIRPASWCRA